MVAPPRVHDRKIDPAMSQYALGLEQSSEILSDLLQPYVGPSRTCHESVKIRDMTFGERLDKLREANNLSVKELAKRLHYGSSNTIQRWIDGKIQPRLDQAAAVAAFFGETICSMLGESPVKRPSSPELTRDEDLVLETFHSLGLDRREAIRRLHGGGAATPSVIPDPGTSVEDVEAERKRAANGEMPRKPKPKGIG